jgi:hypothetical protein
MVRRSLSMKTRTSKESKDRTTILAYWIVFLRICNYQLPSIYYAENFIVQSIIFATSYETKI